MCQCLQCTMVFGSKPQQDLYSMPLIVEGAHGAMQNVSPSATSFLNYTISFNIQIKINVFPIGNSVGYFVHARWKLLKFDIA